METLILFLFHQYLDIEQLFPICFSAFFAGDAPEVFPDFVVEGIDFGGFGVGDCAVSGTVHFVLLSAYKRMVINRRDAEYFVNGFIQNYTFVHYLSRGKIDFFSNAPKVDIFFAMSLY